MTTTTWRDLADQLTPDQIDDLKFYEKYSTWTAENLVFEARRQAAQNLSDQLLFGHIPLPEHAETWTHWETDETGRSTRRVFLPKRSAGAAAIYVNGVQNVDGGVEWAVCIEGLEFSNRAPYGCAQTRQLAGLLLDITDEMDAR